MPRWTDSSAFAPHSSWHMCQSMVCKIAWIKRGDGSRIQMLGHFTGSGSEGVVWAPLWTRVT